MGKAEFISEIESRGIAFSCDEPMKKHTTFKIGGNADVFIDLQDEAELIFAVKTAREHGVPFYIIGKGSDLLVSDEGVEGAVICLNGLRGIKINGNTVSVRAGQNMSSLCSGLQKAGLSGLEFAYGIPGTVGGAVYMNAGAYGGEIADRIVSARYLDAGGEVKVISKQDMRLSYRDSVFQKNGGIILSAEFELEYGDAEEIRKKMEGFLCSRQEKQPLDMPSAGSAFKRPQGNFAGTLIEKSGLKGMQIGGAAVSGKHAGFIVNTGNATSGDVMALIKAVRQKVYADSGVDLEPEIIFIGR